MRVRKKCLAKICSEVMAIKKMLLAIAGQLFLLVNWVAPKNKSKTVLCVYPEVDDMVRGILPYLDGNIVILAKKVRNRKPEWINDDVCVLRKNSVLGVFHILTAKRIYFTHGIFSFFRLINERRQFVVNLWHGMSFKNVGLLEGERKVVKSHITICTSMLFQRLQAIAFGMDPSRVMVSGLPRNDILVRESSNTKILKNKKNYNNVYVWLPTYRKSKEGDIREDGDTHSIFVFDSFDSGRLNKILSKNGDILYIKPHPMSVLNDLNFKFSNIKLIDDDWLNENNMSLYELLSSSDGLWTDYSSVFIDYVLTKKPILFVSPDFEIYKKRRGFAFDIESHRLPGLLIVKQEKLFEVLKNPKMWKMEYKAEVFNSVPKFNNDMIQQDYIVRKTM
jgi:CDP-glycerol glycerophosphotransferase (TagB/SpsB family)